MPVLAFASAKDFGRWISRQPAASKGLWLKIAKKGCSEKSVSRQDAIATALCHGWIDGQIDKYDEHWWLTRFTPRTPRSKWSQINCNTALRLIDEGRMLPAGFAQVEAAKADGRWDAAYPAQSKATVPPDLQVALDANPVAKRFFAKLDGANRFAVLYRVQEPKLAATRARRIEKFVAMLERGETVHPPTKKSQSPDSKEP
ncbi:YdeI/OmpD-associated family protein [Variovorax sp. J22R133]|uniref:YdeI/OmpD-associated family protein n=1 Tax=Variovorax brevis TaxID=3053503 RepID=UPI00257558A5|nr:YdeI/OmpD-associated family protein [Variovorax sp. J22R133]MDM0115031.1 YdeI/OmpD-associated family protein [Variovorax sp. J22R133]